MKSLSVLRIMIWAVLLSMCASAAAQNNAVPFLTQSLNPASVAPGSKTFTLTVNGTGFASSAVVNWNGSTRLTEVISSSQLKATINASDVSSPQTAWITVTNSAPGGGTSNVIFFPVRSRSSSLGMAISQPFAGATAVAVGDFNNDGKLDVAWVTASALNVSLGNGNGTFQPAITTITNGGESNPYYLLTGDFNGDGNLDLVLGNDGGVWLFLGNGNGTFTGSPNPVGGFNGGNEGIGVADFNQDGNLDIYIAGLEADYEEFAILTGNGDGTFGYDCCYVTGSPPGAGDFGILSGAPAVGDFNQDGYLDLAIGGYPNGSDGEIEIFLGTANGGFTQGTTISGVYAINVATADVNNDGKLDLITDNGCVLLGNGDGTFRPCTALLAGELDGVGDFTGNHILDVANNGGYPPPGIAVNLGAGNGTFPTDVTFPGPTAGYAAGAIGDFNNDGRLDVVTSLGYLLIQTRVDLAPISLNFGSQDIGTTSAAQTATLTNVGASSLAIEKIAIIGAGSKNFHQTNDCGSSLAAGANCTISVTFTPSSGGAVSATLEVRYEGAGSPETVALSGTGVTSPTVSLVPSSLSFTAQLIGTTSPAQTATLANTGDQTVTISNIAVSGAFTQTNDCPTSLGVSGVCQIQVVFSPSQAGNTAGTLSVTDNALNSPQQVSLNGAGTAITLVPSAVNFGDQNIGTLSSVAPITLSNIGTLAVGISSIVITGADPKDFLEGNKCGSTLPADSSCKIQVRFRPTQTGARSAVVSISDGGGASPQTVPLSGTGTQN
jgi:hypothetical protein